MKNKIFTTGEVLTIRTNLKEIEKNLGHSIPGGFIDSSDLKDHILSPGEVVTVCENIRSVRGPSSRRSSGTSSTDIRHVLIVTGVLVLASIFFNLLGSVFGIYIW